MVGTRTVLLGRYRDVRVELIDLFFYEVYARHAVPEVLVQQGTCSNGLLPIGATIPPAVVLGPNRSK
jgi:hypothetical protein